MNIIFTNEAQVLEIDSYGMYTTGFLASVCDPIASCDTNFDD